jgi:hypothetical protein
MTGGHYGMNREGRVTATKKKQGKEYFDQSTVPSLDYEEAVTKEQFTTL